jgi:Zn-dependent peptidase ImmA (M78 family)
LKNIYLRDRIALQIDSQVGRILRDLGNPEPPLNLDEVRTLLKIDLQYYTADDPNFIEEFVHRARHGIHEIAQTAISFLQAVKRWDLKAAFFPESNRIVIDRDSPPPKWRWSEGHEVIHSVLPWHRPLMFADSRLTLAPDCSFKMEAEANFGCGRLLTLQDVFKEEALSSPLCWSQVKELSKRYRNTMTSTLWRLIEVQEIPAFGIVGFHPYHYMEGSGAGDPCKYFISSRAFQEQFASFTEKEGVDIFESYCRTNKGGPLGSKKVLIRDVNGDEHEFLFESFSNTHETLTVAKYVRKRQIAVAFPRLAPRSA